MKLKSSVLFFIGFFLAVVFLTAEGQALKARFLQRKPVIERMKKQEKVGENNVGKLVPRARLNEEENKIVRAENADREKVYQKIAGKLNISILKVGQRRALQIAQRASPGHWLQHPDGHWYRKK